MKKSAKVTKQRKTGKVRRRAVSPRRHSNARPRAGTRTRPSARVATTMPIGERIKGFLVDIANAGFHLETLAKWRLNWGKDVRPRITEGDPQYDKEFADGYATAKKCGAEYRNLLREDAADIRAMVGWDEPVFQYGRCVGAVRRFSDRLHEIMLKAGNPGRFAERHEFGGPNGQPLAAGVIVVPAAIPAPREGVGGGK